MSLPSFNDAVKKVKKWDNSPHQHTPKASNFLHLKKLKDFEYLSIEFPWKEDNFRPRLVL